MATDHDGLAWMGRFCQMGVMETVFYGLPMVFPIPMAACVLLKKIKPVISMCVVATAILFLNI